MGQSVQQLEVLLRQMVREVVREELNMSPAATPAAADDPPSVTVPLHKAVYTSDEVGQLLGLTRKAVFARAARGQLPGAFKLGRSLRFRGPELLRFVAEGRAPSPRGTRR